MSIDSLDAKSSRMATQRRREAGSSLRSFSSRLAGVTFLPELLIVLVAALTRFWRLGYHSIWFDEAVSLDWASADIGYTWVSTWTLVKDKHPPFYYIFLHGWMQLLGWLGLAHNDIALRASGSLLGVLTVVGMLLLVRRVSSRPVSLLAGLWTALNPLLVWYSQELRMFQPATTALVWAAYSFESIRIPWLRQGRNPWPSSALLFWLGFIVMTLAALYTYLFSAFLLPVFAILLLSTLSVSGQRFYWPRHPFAQGVTALAVITLLFAPLAWNAWTVNSAEGAPGAAFANLGQTLWRLLRIFTIWRVDWSPGWQNVALTLCALLVVCGLLSKQGRWLWVWLGVPLLIGNLLLARDSTVFAEDRYFLFLAPFVLWAIAEGALAVASPLLFGKAVGRARLLSWLAGGLVTLTLAAALPSLWTLPMQRENWRAASDVITSYQSAAPALRAAVVAHVDYTKLSLEWYLRQRFNQEELPLYYPFGGTLTLDQVESVVAPPLQGIVDLGVDTLWLTQSHLAGVDEGHWVEEWLNQRFPLVTEQYPAGIKLTGYALRSHYPTLPELAPQAERPNAELAPGLILAACEIINPQLSANDEQLHPPSGWVHVRLWWRANAVPSEDYIASVQMVGSEGVWGDRLYRANETLRRWPTSQWAVGTLLRDEVDVNLNPLTPKGEYPIVVGVRNSADQAAGTTTNCGRVKIVEQ